MVNAISYQLKSAWYKLAVKVAQKALAVKSEKWKLSFANPRLARAFIAVRDKAVAVAESRVGRWLISDYQYRKISDHVLKPMVEPFTYEHYWKTPERERLALELSKELLGLMARDRRVLDAPYKFLDNSTIVVPEDRDQLSFLIFQQLVRQGYLKRLQSSYGYEVGGEYVSGRDTAKEQYEQLMRGLPAEASANLVSYYLDPYSNIDQIAWSEVARQVRLTGTDPDNKLEAARRLATILDQLPINRINWHRFNLVVGHGLELDSEARQVFLPLYRRAFAYHLENRNYATLKYFIDPLLLSGEKEDLDQVMNACVLDSRQPRYYGLSYEVWPYIFGLSSGGGHVFNSVLYERVPFNLTAKHQPLPRLTKTGKRVEAWIKRRYRSLQQETNPYIALRPFDIFALGWRYFSEGQFILKNLPPYGGIRESYFGPGFLREGKRLLQRAIRF